MADTYTPHYNFVQPTVGGDYNTWGALLNGNWGSVDTALYAVSQVANAALPLAGGTLTGALTMGAGTVLTLAADPGSALQAATKRYVDSAVAGVSVPVTSVFGRVGAVTLGSADVTGALGFTPTQVNGSNAVGTWPISVTGNAAYATNAGAAGNANTVTTITGSQVNAACGFTPAPAPSGAGPGIGQWTTLTPGASATYLPAGGAWAWFFSNNGTGAAGANPGGTLIFSGTPYNFFGFCWRIA